MSDNVYGFKNDKCKVEVPTKEEFNETKAKVKNITIGTEAPTGGDDGDIYIQIFD